MKDIRLTADALVTKNQIYSAMVVYGLLTYENGEVFIPNKELMLKATLEQDTGTMSEILQFVHNTETPILSYNHETELAAVVNLVYLSARDKYRVEKEKGYLLRFEGKLGELPQYTGRVLAVGIGYQRDTKEHSCEVEILR